MSSQLNYLQSNNNILGNSRNNINHIKNDRNLFSNNPTLITGPLRKSYSTVIGQKISSNYNNIFNEDLNIFHNSSHNHTNSYKVNYNSNSNRKNYDAEKCYNNFKKLTCNSIYSSDNFRKSRYYSQSRNSNYQIRKLYRDICKKRKEEINYLYKTSIKTTLAKTISSLYSSHSNNNNKNNDLNKCTDDMMKKKPIYDYYLTNEKEKLKNNSTTKLMNCDSVNDIINVSKNSFFKLTNNSDLSNQNLHIKLGSLIGDLKSGDNLTYTTKEILKLKSFLDLKKSREINLKYEINDLLNELHLNLKTLKHQQIVECEKFTVDYDKYLKFLKKKISYENTILDNCQLEHKKEEKSIEILIEKIISLQKTLEFYLEIRDFFVQLKENKTNLPKYCIMKSFEQGKSRIAIECFNTMKGRISKRDKINFFIHQIHIKENHLKYIADDNSMTNSELINSYNAKYYNTNNFINNEKYDFFSDIIEHENINVNLLLKLNKKNEEIYGKKNELSRIKNLEGIKKSKENEKEEVLKKILDSLYSKYLYNENLKSSAINSYFSEDIDLRKHKYNIYKNKSMNAYDIIKDIKKYKYSKLFYKLLNFILYFIDIDYKAFNINRIYRIICREDIAKMKELKINDDNQSYVSEYILKLFNILEQITECVLQKNEDYIQSPIIKPIIEILLNERQKSARIKNSKIARMKVEEKRLEKINEVAKKTNKNIFLQKRKNPDYKGLVFKKKEKKTVDKVEKDNSFEELVKYHE